MPRWYGAEKKTFFNSDFVPYDFVPYEVNFSATALKSGPL